MTTIAAFISKHRIRFDYTYGEPRGDDSEWDRSAYHFKVTIKCGRRQLTVPYHMGSGTNGNPELRDVLDCLASDASGIDNADSFEDWCDEYGYDPDSRKAESTYKACQTEATQLERLLGRDLLNELHECDR